nr:MAG TPA: hypothetical protein [Caudoviricetes sp.]
MRRPPKAELGKIVFANTLQTHWSALYICKGSLGQAPTN